MHGGASTERTFHHHSRWTRWQTIAIGLLGSCPSRHAYFGVRLTGLLERRTQSMADSEMPPGFGPNDPDAPDLAETEYTDASFDAKEHRPIGDPPVSYPWIMIDFQGEGLKRID